MVIFGVICFVVGLAVGIAGTVFFIGNAVTLNF